MARKKRLLDNKYKQICSSSVKNVNFWTNINANTDYESSDAPYKSFSYDSESSQVCSMFIYLFLQHRLYSLFILFAIVSISTYRLYRSLSQSLYISRHWIYFYFKPIRLHHHLKVQQQPKKTIKICDNKIINFFKYKQNLYTIYNIELCVYNIEKEKQNKTITKKYKS